MDKLALLHMEVHVPRVGACTLIVTKVELATYFDSLRRFRPFRQRQNSEFPGDSLFPSRGQANNGRRRAYCHGFYL